MKAIPITPRYDNSNGWSKIIAPRTSALPLSEDIHADWVVVGAGLAGLAAARRLAEMRPHDSIALLEAAAVGDGSHGRNSGFLIDIPHNVGSSMAELHDAQRHLRLARAAIASIKSVVEKHRIACDWSAAGKFHAAVSKAGAAQILKPTMAMLEALHQPYEWLEGQALHERLGFSHFKTGIYTPGTVLLNPAAYCHGAADNLPSNVTLYEHTPVTHITRGEPIELRTPQATLKADRLILTVNIFSSQFGLLKNRALPLSATASLTRPLTPAEQEALGGLSSWGLTPANSFVGITMRRTPDQRILIRQGFSYDPSLYKSDAYLQRIKAQHQQLFDTRFPMLSGVTMEHTWSGLIAVTGNGASSFGEVAPNIYSSAFYNGVGFTKGTIGGLLIADLACGMDNPLLGDMLALQQPNALPPRPFLDVGVKARLAWELMTKRGEA